MLWCGNRLTAALCFISFAARVCVWLSILCQRTADNFTTLCEGILIMCKYPVAKMWTTERNKAKVTKLSFRQLSCMSSGSVMSQVIQILCLERIKGKKKLCSISYFHSLQIRFSLTWAAHSLRWMSIWNLKTFEKCGLLPWPTPSSLSASAASKAVECLLDSKWAKAKKGEEAVFTTRESVLDYCNRWATELSPRVC